MNAPEVEQNGTQRRIRRLRRQLTDLANTVESLFADSVMALIERNAEFARQLRREDCRAHERWFEVDKNCAALIEDGAGFEAGSGRYIAGVIKIAICLKKVAECLESPPSLGL